MRSLPARYKIDVAITPGAHLQEAQVSLTERGERARARERSTHPNNICASFQVNKQLADKERVAAALENGNLIDVVHKCLVDGNRIGGAAPLLTAQGAETG